jgi:hypothetical protein
MILASVEARRNIKSAAETSLLNKALENFDQNKSLIHTTRRVV